MSHRARAIAFALAALACAAVAASIASGYRSGVEAQLGPLREVVVARASLEPRRRIGNRAARRTLEVRRVPARFAPGDALRSPLEAIGRVPVVPIPAGGYVVGSELRTSRSPHSVARSPLGRGRAPVEIAVTGAAALSGGGEPGRARGLVDVIVTAEPHGDSAEGRTYVAAARVRLLSLRPGSAGGADDLSTGLPDTWTATLALSRSQALQLIQAQNFAREVRLVPST